MSDLSFAYGGHFVHNLIFAVRMESTNRSGLQCFEHPREEVTNFCVNVNCLKPLCPDCVEVHTQHHQQQEILSWKHCLSNAALKMKSTLEELRLLLDAHRPQRGPKSLETIEAESTPVHI